MTGGLRAGLVGTVGLFGTAGFLGGTGLRATMGLSATGIDFSAATGSETLLVGEKFELSSSSVELFRFTLGLGLVTGVGLSGTLGTVGFSAGFVGSPGGAFAGLVVLASIGGGNLN